MKASFCLLSEKNLLCSEKKCQVQYNNWFTENKTTYIRNYLFEEFNDVNKCYLFVFLIFLFLDDCTKFIKLLCEALKHLNVYDILMSSLVHSVEVAMQGEVTIHRKHCFIHVTVVLFDLGRNVVVGNPNKLRVIYRSYV